LNQGFLIIGGDQPVVFLFDRTWAMKDNSLVSERLDSLAYS